MSDPNGRVRALNTRLRRAFLDGAEEQSRLRHGRGLTADELKRVLGRYPGDISDETKGGDRKRAP
jgi:hypothetical protein